MVYSLIPFVIMWQSRIKIAGGIKIPISWLLRDNPLLSRWVQCNKRNSERDETMENVRVNVIKTG